MIDLVLWACMGMALVMSSVAVLWRAAGVLALFAGALVVVPALIGGNATMRVVGVLAGVLAGLLALMVREMRARK